MPGALVDDDFLSDLDEIRTLGGELGLRPFRVTVRKRVWTYGQPGRPGSIYTDTDTILANEGADGSLQPVMVRELKRDEVFASGGAYASRDLKVGPITPAFAAAISAAGGFDDNTLDPTPTTQATQIIWIVSSPNGTHGIPAGSVRCEKKGEENSALHTFIILRSTGRAPT